jgi:hypothetical protein
MIDVVREDCEIHVPSSFGTGYPVDEIVFHHPVEGRCLSLLVQILELEEELENTITKLGRIDHADVFSDDALFLKSLYSVVYLFAGLAKFLCYVCSWCSCIEIQFVEDFLSMRSSFIGTTYYKLFIYFIIIVRIIIDILIFITSILIM